MPIMKKAYFAILLLLSGLAFGQNYRPFPDSAAVWREHYYDNYGQDHYQYGILGDTVIGSLTYHKIYYQPSCLGDTAISISNSSLIGAIREDSLRRIFFYNMAFWGGSVDSVYKLYEFPAHVGDTVRFSHPFSFIFPYLVADTIDSVWTYDHYSRRYHFPQETWIEGIGSLRSLFSAIMGYPTCFCVWENVCYKYLNTTYYLNPPFLDCYDLSHGIIDNERTKEKITIYPDPIVTTGTVDLTGLTYQPERFEIFDILGEKIKVFKVPESKKIIIDRNEFKPGLYVYSIIANEQYNINGKFLIE
jgi:hypothetical protein